MNYNEAIRTLWIKRIFGTILFILAGISTLISFLLMINNTFNIDKTALGKAIGNIINNLINVVHERTSFLNFFWEHSPTPDLTLLTSPENIKFISIYFLALIGIAFFTSGNKLAKKIRSIDSEIEYQQMKASIANQNNETRQIIEDRITINNTSMLSNVHQLYFAPLVVTIIAAIILKLLGY